MYTWLPGINDPQEKYLFKGTSCYPLSPCSSVEQNSGKVSIHKSDQLLKILSILGS